MPVTLDDHLPVPVMLSHRQFRLLVLRSSGSPGSPDDGQTGGRLIGRSSGIGDHHRPVIPEAWTPVKPDSRPSYLLSTMGFIGSSERVQDQRASVQPSHLNAVILAPVPSNHACRRSGMRCSIKTGEPHYGIK
jgi:hypothetical protein